jgi:VIT1/CCC1 family predicted Fe2+/Mn2+ transporter
MKTFTLFKQKTKLPFDREYFSSLFSGLEGGLATTTAIIVGLAITTERREVIITTAVISFMVQAFNSSVGKFSAERTDDEIDNIESWKGYRKPIYNALLQFLSHILISLVALTPFVFITNTASAISATIMLTLFILFIMGIFKGFVIKLHPFKDGLELFILGALVISVGIVSGFLLS